MRGKLAPVTNLTVRIVLFSVVVPGLGAVVGPWWILNASGREVRATHWVAAIVIGLGAALYIACARAFAVVGRGTPGPWDAPRRLVTVGPYLWVRNPIYLSALLVVLGEAWLFQSRALLIYAVAMAACFHLFVVAYEEPRLRREFGASYDDYARRVHRWTPRRPARNATGPGNGRQDLP